MMTQSPKTIFAAGLFPDKNKVFLRNLCQHFRVIMLRSQSFKTGTKFAPEAAEDLLSPDDLQINYRDLGWELVECIRFTESQLGELFPESNCRLDKDEFKQLFDTTTMANLMVHIFKKVAEIVQIDMVVANADYSVFRRPIVLEAKRLGIPTLDIEHGFFATKLEPSALISKSKMPSLIFFSDYVNLDNQIEKEIWEEYYKYAGLEQRVKFLALGTPNDKTFNRDVSRKDGHKFLGLDENSVTITVASTWVEARIPTAAISGQLEHGEFFSQTLKCLQNLQEKESVQIIIKLHPAFSPKPIFDAVKTYLERFAASIGLSISLITWRHISEVIAASDLIICPHISSILWECFMAGTPGIVFPIPSFYFATYRKEKLNESNILSRRGLLKFVTNTQELLEAANHYLNEANYEEFKKRAAKLCRDKKILTETVEEKSLRICKWIKELLMTDVSESTPKEVAYIEDERVELFLQMAEEMFLQGSRKDGHALLNQVLQMAPEHAEALAMKERFSLVRKLTRPGQ